jgi:hypothetical protein
MEFLGEWYLPKKRTQKVQGILTVSDGDITLRLMGVLSRSDNPMAFESYPIILGYLYNNKDVTLVNCLFGGRTSSMPGKSHSSYRPNLALIGVKFNTENQIKFKSVTVGFDLLTKWVSLYGHNIQLSKENFHQINIEYKNPESIQFRINKEIKGKFIFTHTIPVRVNPKVEIEQETFLALISNKKYIPYQEFIKLIQRFNKFLSLGIQERATPTSFSFGLQDGNKYIEAYIYLGKKEKLEKELDSYDFLFTYKDIQNEFESAIEKWFTDETLDPIVNSIDCYVNHLQTFQEDRFLDIVQGLESYHRRKLENSKILKQEFNQKLSEVIHGLPPRDKKWIESLLEYKYEPNLRRRLKDLLQKETFEIISKLVPKNTQKKFIDQVANSRNYYTHYNEDLRKSAIPASKLSRTIRTLYVLLLCYLLFEIGFSVDLINRCIAKRQYKYISQFD